MKKFLFGMFFIPLIALGQKRELEIGVNAHYEVRVTTSAGIIDLKLYNDTPIHRDNFVKLCNDNFYNHVIFHRVIKDFVIQAGDPTSKSPSAVAKYGDNDSGYELPAEIREQYYHKKGVLAAARTPDDANPERKSSGSQFYIALGKVYNDSMMMKLKETLKERSVKDLTPELEQIYRTVGGIPHLDGAYTIFGEVEGGLKVVEKISKIKTTKLDRPIEDVFIKSTVVKVMEDK